MASSLGNTGTISYNGWTFAGPRIKTALSIQPEYDRSGRTVISDTYTIDVTAWVTDNSDGLGGTGGSASLNMTSIATLLSQSGGALVFSGLGYGDIEVNTNASNRDLKFGPKPQLIRCRPIGGTGAFEVMWTVTACIARCGSGSIVGTVGNLRSFNYGATYNIDRAGLLTRTVAGTIEIILNRSSAGAQTIAKTVDDFKGAFSVTIPNGFRRDRYDWQIADDKSSANFTIVDSELPSNNAFPPGVIDMSMTHSVGVSRPRIATITNTISGSVDYCRPYTAGLVWERVLMIIRERIQNAKAKAKNAVILDDVLITESIFERRIDFSVRYRILGTKFGKLLSTTGLFSPIASTNFQSWGQSLDQTAWHNRGVSRLKMNAADDKIVDVCNQPGTIKITDVYESRGASQNQGELTNDCPPKDSSYIGYDSWLKVDTDTPTVELYPIPSVSPAASVVAGGLGAAALGAMVKGPDGSAYPPGTEKPPSLGSSLVRSILQKVGEASVKVTLSGRGLRVCYPVEIPSLVKIWEKEPKIQRSLCTIENSEIGTMGGLPVYAAKWSLTYIVAFDDPSEIARIIGDTSSAVIKTDDDQNRNKQPVDKRK
ncbi:MAG: hypothetical protein IT428_19800 [Planctomycetaceae bacterium]|nr:hypothetical protein [Planctomycetaceae bacterium]